MDCSFRLTDYAIRAQHMMINASIAVSTVDWDAFIAELEALREHVGGEHTGAELRYTNQMIRRAKLLKAVAEDQAQLVETEKLFRNADAQHNRN